MDSSQISESILFRLPAELRNRIYSYALVEEDAVAITPGLRLAPLLCTCKRIRHEALKLWFHENSFMITVAHCDATLLNAFVQLLEHLDVADPQATRIVINLTDWTGHWGNLMQWCERLRAGHSRGVQLPIPPASNASERQQAQGREMVGTAHAIALSFLDHPPEVWRMQMEKLRRVVWSRECYAARRN